MNATRFIADAGSNHCGLISRALDLTLAAAEVGADGIKFQLFRADKLWRDPATRERMRPRELPVAWLPALRDKAHALGLEFQVTPFDLEAVEILKPFADSLKVGSYEANWGALITACLLTGKPTDISFGFGWHSLGDLDIWSSCCKRRTYYWCCPEYPASAARIDWSAVSDRFDDGGDHVYSGYSDHTRDPIAIHRAHACGVSAIEFHLDLEDGDGWESAHGHCWLPSEIAPVIRSIREYDSTEKYDPATTPLRAQRTDPRDGMRPMLEVE